MDIQQIKDHPVVRIAASCISAVAMSKLAMEAYKIAELVFNTGGFFDLSAGVLCMPAVEIAVFGAGSIVFGAMSYLLVKSLVVVPSGWRKFDKIEPTEAVAFMPTAVNGDKSKK